MGLRDGIIATANSLGINPVDLATVISYETAGTFDPTKAGPTTQWGQHRGLIQFGEPQAQKYGVNWDDPVGSQLGENGAIAQYLRDTGVKQGMGLMDIYSAVNAGGVNRYNRSDANNGGAPGTVADKVNNQMAGHKRKALDLIGGDGSDMLQGGLTMQTEKGTDKMQGIKPEERQLGLLGRFLGPKAQASLTPDRIARMQLALEGATLNPNQGVIASAQSTLKEGADMRTRNKTVEWLVAQGREDLAQAVYSQGIPPQAAVAEALKKPPTTSGITEYEFAVANGYKGSLLDFQSAKAQNGAAGFAALEAQARAAGLEPGSPEYQQFMLNGGGQPATFRALQQQALAGGLEPGTPEYQEFMRTRGAGDQAAAKTRGENLEDIETGGDAAQAIEEGKVKGRNAAEKGAEVRRMEAQMPGLRTVVSQLYELADDATYTKAGTVFDELQKQAGLPATEGAIAKAKYVAMVNNQVLPLLRDTFGAAFTAKEGESLKATLGDPLMSPEEKKAVLDAFIAQKERDLIAKGGTLPPEEKVSATENSVKQPNNGSAGATHRFNPKTGKVDPIK